MRIGTVSGWLGLACALSFCAHGGAPPVGVVSHIKVLSSNVEDVSSLAAWQRSFIKEGMSDQEKAKAVWRSVVEFQHQDLPPVEYLQAGGDVLDPIKLFNVYGYSYCSVASANSQALGRYAGLNVRGWTINQHVVPEYQWDGTWHLLDGSLITYFPTAKGSLASVKEIVGGVKDWYARNPDLKGKDGKLRQFMTGGGWKKGPAVLAYSPFYDDNGWLPAATHGWYSTMQEYDGSTLFPFEAGYSLGYEVNIQLRKGERLTRNWSNQGLHVNMEKGNGPGCIRATAGKGDLRYTPQFGDLAPGRVGNGRIEYEVPLRDETFRLGMLAVENLVSRGEALGGPGVHVNDGSRPGVLRLRMPSSYVYLGGEMVWEATVLPGDGITVLLSDNNSLDWREITNVTKSGVYTLDLKPYVFRRYDYRLKFVMNGRGTGLEALKISHDIQHSQRALPALALGENTISFSADSAEGSIAVEGSTEIRNKGRQLLFTDFHPKSAGLAKDKMLLAQPSGEITFPVETPGEMTRVRIGTCYRARDAQDGWDVQLSFDDGATFKTVDRLEGPKVTFSKYTVVDVPPGVRTALVRYAGTQHNTTMISNFRISADYREPRGGFRPVKVVYEWEENGQPKEDVHVVTSPTESYKIHCETRPQMKSISLELAD